MTPEQRDLLQKWERDTKSIYRAHYTSSVRTQDLSKWLGVPTVILSALIGTSIFAALGRQPTVLAQIVAGLASMLVTVLAALQTFLRYSERAERHQATAAGFAALNREAKLLLAAPLDDDGTMRHLDSFRQRWDELSKNAPTARTDAWKGARERTALEYAEPTKSRNGG